MRVQHRVFAALLGTAWLLPTIAAAGPFDGPDRWSSTFPFFWVVLLMMWVGPVVLGISGILAIIHKLKRKSDAFILLLRTFVVALVSLLLLYTVVLAVLFALTANFEG